MLALCSGRLFKRFWQALAEVDESSSVCMSATRGGAGTERSGEANAVVVATVAVADVSGGAGAASPVSSEREVPADTIF